MPDLMPLATAYAQVQQAILSDELDDAERILRHVLTYFPKAARAHSLLGDVLVGRGRDPEALDEYTLVASVDPLDGDTYAKMARAAARCGRADDAETYRELAADNFGPPSDSAHAPAVLSPARLGILNLRCNLPFQAVNQLNQVLAAEQHRLDLLVALTQALWLADLPDPAYRAAGAVLDAAPDCLPAIIIAAEWAARGGRLEALEAHLNHALSLEPDPGTLATRCVDASVVEDAHPPAPTLPVVPAVVVVTAASEPIAAPVPLSADPPPQVRAVMSAHDEVTAAPVAEAAEPSGLPPEPARPEIGDWGADVEAEPAAAWTEEPLAPATTQSFSPSPWMSAQDTATAEPAASDEVPVWQTDTESSWQWDSVEDVPDVVTAAPAPGAEEPMTATAAAARYQGADNEPADLSDFDTWFEAHVMNAAQQPTTAPYQGVDTVPELYGIDPVGPEPQPQPAEEAEPTWSEDGAEDTAVQALPAESTSLAAQSAAEAAAPQAPKPGVSAYPETGEQPAAWAESLSHVSDLELPDWLEAWTESWTESFFGPTGSEPTVVAREPERAIPAAEPEPAVPDTVIQAPVDEPGPEHPAGDILSSEEPSGAHWADAGWANTGGQWTDSWAQSFAELASPYAEPIRETPAEPSRDVSVSSAESEDAAAPVEYSAEDVTVTPQGAPLALGKPVASMAEDGDTEVDMLARRIEREPLNNGLRFDYARAMEGAGNLEGAVAQYGVLVKSRDPRLLPEIQQRLEALRATEVRIHGLQRTLGDVYMQQHSYERAIEAYSLAFDELRSRQLPKRGPG